MAEINRRSVLIECLAIMREELQICSKNWNGLEPKEGMEDAWEQGRQKIEILKDMIAALSSEPVRRALADWQKELMVKGIQTEIKFDGEDGVLKLEEPKYVAYRSDYSEIDGEWIEKRYKEGDLLDHSEKR